MSHKQESFVFETTLGLNLPHAQPQIVECSLPLATPFMLSMADHIEEKIEIPLSRISFGNRQAGAVGGILHVPSCNEPFGSKFCGIFDFCDSAHFSSPLDRTNRYREVVHTMGLTIQEFFIHLQNLADEEQIASAVVSEPHYLYWGGGHIPPAARGIELIATEAMRYCLNFPRISDLFSSVQWDANNLHIRTNGYRYYYRRCKIPQDSMPILLDRWKNARSLNSRGPTDSIQWKLDRKSINTKRRWPKR